MSDTAFDFLDFDIFDYDAAGADVLEETRVEAIVPDDALDTYLLRSHAYWQQIPVPPELSLAGTNILAGISDEVLLGMSPSLIVHIQRTEASGGLQVISPRTVTLGGIAARTAHTSRTTDMFLVGSAASRNLEWPTLHGSVPEHLFWREPIDAYPSEPAPRSKTVSSGILASRRLLHDPISKAFLTGRALVDLQRRSDVAGSADALSRVLATCWGIDPDTYEDMAEASLAPVGSLLRYAIRSDDVYPVINAPIQARKCITVGANTAGRHLYGESAAIDWRRLRVQAESIFYQCSRLEGYTLLDMVSHQLPGNPRAPPNRPGILQMRPLPGSVWSFDSATFRLDIDCDASAVVGVSVPQRVRDSVENFHLEARPVARAEQAGTSISFVPTMVKEHVSETGEAIIKGYKMVLANRTGFSARGRTAAAAVRGFVYDCLASCTTLHGIRSLWLARYMHATTAAMNLAHLLDARATRHVASRMSEVVDDIRTKLGAEAGRRGATLEDWWTDMSAQLPREFAGMSEGSASWAIAAAHFMLHPPTPNWASLVRAMAYASHETLARGHLSDVRLPAKIGSPERVFQAGAAVARQLGSSYGAYYTAMHDVAQVLSARLKRGGNAAGAQKMVIAGMMWDIRAKVASTVTLHLDDGTSTSGGIINGRLQQYHITTAPYPAYHRWHQMLNSSGIVSRDSKALFPHHTGGLVSQCFAGVARQLFPVPAGSHSRLFRYVINPSNLAADIERTLDLMITDISAVIKHYDAEGDQSRNVSNSSVPAKIPIAPLALDLSKFKPATGTLWDMLLELDNSDAAFVVDAISQMDHADAEEFESATYNSGADLLRSVMHKAEDTVAARAKGRDGVI